MLLCYPFWMFMGFTLQFYIIFGTNLLTGGPTQNCCFLPISEFRRKRISNGVQTEWNRWERDFWNKRDPEDLDPTSRKLPGRHEVGGAPTPLGAPPYLVAASVVAWHPLQVSRFAFVPKRSLPKVSSHLDSVWYSFSSKHRNWQKNSNSRMGVRLIG